MPISATSPSTAERPKPGAVYGLSPPVIGTLLAFSLVGVLTPNPLLTVASLAVLPLIIALPWRPGEPPVLPFVLCFHWLQATAKVFHADLIGADVGDLVIYTQFGQFTDVETATWLSLAGILVVAVGMWLAIRTMDPQDKDGLLGRVEAFSLGRTFVLYLVVTFGLTALYGSLGYWNPLRQIVLGLVQLKWAAYFLVGYVVLVRRQGYIYWAAAFAIEFISGIGFFSGFKEVIFVTAITYFAARSRITVSTVAKIGAMALVLIVLGAGWTVVKPEYRAALVGGERSQSTVMDDGEQVALLYELASGLDGDDIVEGIEPLAERLAYVDFFGYVLGYVPEVVPYQNGGQWGAAVKHILTPRILFPDKPAIVSDSEITNRFTGLSVAGDEAGTSFSIGYMGESYVDFGPFWMFVPILLVGVWRGLMYRFFLRKPDQILAGYAFAVALFTLTYQLEVATGKLLGGVLMRFIVLALIFQFVVPYVVTWLQKGREEDFGAEESSLPIRRAWA